MASTTGKVDYLLVKEAGIAWVSVDSSLFLLWNNDHSVDRIAWFSMCKEALARDLEVVVTHDVNSSSPSQIQLNNG